VTKNTAQHTALHTNIFSVRLLSLCSWPITL